MKLIAGIAACSMVLSFGAASFAQYEQNTQASQNQQNTQPQTQSGSMMGAGPAGGMSDMMGMCMMMHPAIAVDANAVYVVRGNQVVKLSKKDFRVLATGTLPQPPAMKGMGSMGGMSGSGMAGQSPAMMGEGPAATVRPEMAQMMQQMRQMQSTQFEQNFLQNMIRHHQGALAMSRLAIAKATHPELRRFAQRTINNQGREEQEFASWLKNRYKASFSKQPMPVDVQMSANLNTLSGRDFEIQFLKDMIVHHTEAVQMSRDAEQKAVNPDVKAAATEIAKNQSAEIDQLKSWASSWYGLTL